MRTSDRPIPGRRPARRGALPFAMIAALLAVLGCGGGGGVGSGGTGWAPGVSAGTVNGFGSVVVDGIRYDDRGARVEVENEPGVRSIGEVRLGQRVEVEAAAAGVAGAVRVEAQVRGRVDALVAGGFVVLGQTIVVNSDAAGGPVTQFGDGYAAPIDVLVGDAVEVHGMVRGPATAAVVQATRVDRLDVPPAHLKVAGTVTAAHTAGGVTSFRIGGLAVTADASVVEPAGGAIQDGHTVVVFGSSAGLAYTAGAPTLAAERVRIRTREAGIESYFGGVLAALDTAAKTFVLDGIVVDYGGAVLEPAGATLADGRYVQLRGSHAADGRFVATQVKLRDGSAEPEAELKGNVLGYDAAGGRFTVRDVTVTLTLGTDLECSGGLADGRFVEVHGRLGSDGVIATEVHCEDEPDGATVEREGTAGTPNLAASTVVLTTSRGALTVRWTAQTYFADGLTAATLAGRRLEVRGYFDGAVLVAQKFELDD